MSNKPLQTSSLTLLSVSALGIVFGDIGTSPLYTFKTVLSHIKNAPDINAVLGSLSLIVWTLVIITTIKYINFAMRIDNDGEGGILALMSLLGVKHHAKPFVVAVGLMGAALLYGDGAITPAISVLSALEGLTIITPSFTPYVLPASVGILVALFTIQYKGTAKIGKTFGPIMAIWFLTIGILGVWGISQHPSVLKALNPVYGFSFLFSNGLKGFLILGAVFLCVTGAEALYADMGHLGTKPIRFAWSGLVFPSLVLNYAGQAALVLEGAPLSDNIFYRLCPTFLLIPLVVLATIATIIASQAIISGAFSMTRQAIQLGWLPRLRIIQTSSEGYGQIYVSAVNWMLMFATVGLAIWFGKSDNLAACYGIAVSGTMLATSTLLFIAMREIWHWSLLKAGMIMIVFIFIDAAFFTANTAKIMQGGYVPILLAGLIYGLMIIWHKGSRAVETNLHYVGVPINTFMAKMEQEKIARVPGTAVFLSRITDNTPKILMWHVQQNHALQEKILILNIHTKSIPWVKRADRVILKEVYPMIWRATVFFGFMERVNVPRIIRHILNNNKNLTFDNITYYVEHETIIISHKRANRLPKLVVKILAFMQRNELHESEYYQLPSSQVVTVNRQVEI